MALSVKVTGARRWPALLRRVAGWTLALLGAGLILRADMATGARGLAGVLYIPLFAAVALRGRRWEVGTFGTLCTALSILAWLIDRRSETDDGATWPLVVVVLAVGLTAVSLTRFVASREALQVTNEDLAYSEWRYRSMFEQTRFPFWEQDFSETLALYEDLRRRGVTSLADQARVDPGLPDRIRRSIKTLEVNEAMVRLMEAASRETFPCDLVGMGVDTPTLLRTQQGLFDGATHHDGQSTITTLKGRAKDIWVTGDIGPDRPGIMIGFLFDLTEAEGERRALAAAQAELARASRVATVGALSASIAHELNQPLAALTMNAQTCLRYLRRETPDLAAAAAAAERAGGEAERASAIVQRTRDLTQDRRGREAPVDVVALVREVLALLDPEIRAAAVAVTVDAPASTPRLEADAGALQQVLVNLVGNAVQAMSASTGPRDVVVRVEVDGSEMVVSVRDTGPGIPEAALPRLFEAFFTTKEGGVGVGLAISRAAVEARGGRLTAVNAPEGGAVFQCRLPLMREAA